MEGAAEGMPGLSLALAGGQKTMNSAAIFRAGGVDRLPQCHVVVRVVIQSALVDESPRNRLASPRNELKGNENGLSG
jgi:hypothetical protein